jgi:hypothetical protein
MVYLSGAKNARFSSSIVNQNQGGGNKKAGFPGMVGRDSWTSIFYGTNAKNCCKLSNMQKDIIGWKVSVSRSVGGDSRIPMR